MTLADSGKEGVHLYGPPTLAHAIASMRFYAKRVGCQLSVTEAIDAAAASSQLPSASAVLLDEKDGPIVRSLLSRSENTHQAASNGKSDAQAGPSSMPMERDDSDGKSEADSSSSSRKRPRSPSPGPRLPITAPPMTNAEFDANNLLTATDAESKPDHSSSKATQRRVLDIAHDMFKGATSAENGYTFDDPATVPKGRRGSAAWSTARLPKPCISPVQLWPGALPTQPFALSFAVTLPTALGKMDMQKATKLGVKPGRDLGRLQSGQSITISRPVGWHQFSDESKIEWTRKKPAQTSKRRGKAAAATPSEPQVPQESSVAMEDVEIHSSDCVSPAVPGPVVLVINLPSTSHIPSFLSSANAEALKLATKDHAVTAMVHTCPLEVIRDERYQSWLSANSTAETQHVFTAKELGRNPILFPSPILSLLRLSTMDSKVFAIPPYSLSPSSTRLEDLLPQASGSSQIHPLDFDVTLRLNPRPTGPEFTKFDGVVPEDMDFDVFATTGEDAKKKNAILDFELPDADRNSPDSASGPTARRRLQHARREAAKEFKEVSQKMRAEIAAAEGSEAVLRKSAWEGIKVTTLGTGSAIPTKYRAVSGTLLEIPNRYFASASTPSSAMDVDSPQGSSTQQSLSQYVLLDAGEGTLGQLIQKYGRGQKLENILRHLRIFLVSHIHADHCAGVATILRARAELSPPPTTPLYLVANTFTRQFLEEMNDIQALGLASDGYPGGVIMLEAEHLDYRHGVLGRDGLAAIPAGEDAFSDRYDWAYSAKLKAGFQTGRDRWLERLRTEVLSTDPFAGMDEANLLAQEELIQQQVDQLVAARDTRSVQQATDFTSLTGNLYQLKKPDRDATRRGLQRLSADLGNGIQVHTCEVDHRAKHCYGIVVKLQTRDGQTFSFAYSGDSRPTKNLEEAGTGVDLLIHEATMQDEEKEMAEKKGHSTIGGAIASGKKMGAAVTLLTHFSQRYPKMARMNLDKQEGETSEEKEKRPIVAIGMDLLELEMNEMWKMERYLPAMEVLFQADSYVGGEDGAEGSRAATD